MFYLCIFLSLLSVLGFHSTVRGQLNETAFTSDAQCYGDELVVNATCPLLSSIALNNIRVGTRPNANGCHGNETTGDGTGCCQSSSDACEFDFPISDSVHFYDQCNGGQLCRPGVEKIDVIHGSCNASVYPVFTNYMYFDYFCIEDSRISHMDLGHFTFEDAALYLQSPNYTTSNISSSVSELSCSVETHNCVAVILIYVIERNLAGVMNCTQCNQTQSLSIIEEDGSTLVNWSSKDNTYTISQPLQTAGSYILVNFTNIMTTDGGKFWIGFQASLPTNLTLECPAIEKQYCFPSTTRSTTTTSTTSRSMTTRMTTSKHSSLDTQKTGTAFPTVSSIINTTHRDNNGGNTNNILVIATSVSGGVVLLGLIIAGVVFYKKKKQRQTPDKSKPTPPNLIPSTPVSKDDPKPPPTPPNRTPTTPPPPPRPNRSPTPPQTPPNRTPTPPPNRTPTPPPTPSSRTPTPPPTPPNRTPTPPPNRTPTPLQTRPNRTPTLPLRPPNRTPTPPPTSPNRTPTPPPTPPNRTPTPLPYRTPTPPPTLPNRTPTPLPPPQNRTPTPWPTPPNRSPTPPPTTPNRTPSPPPTTPNRTPTQPLTTPNRTPTPPPTTPKRTPTPPPTTPNRTPSPPPTQLNITPSPKVPEDDPTTTPDKSKVTHIRRISSNMCRRYYKDLLKSLAEDAFLLMIYSEEKNRRRKKRRIKRNLVNPKRL